MQISFKRKLSLITLFCFLWIKIDLQAEDITSYHIRAGTLEMSGQKYIFRSGLDVETFDTSFLGRARESGFPELGIPGPRDLREVGFRTGSGAIHEYGNTWKGNVIDEFVKQNPQGIILSLIFEGRSGQRVEIKGEGKTPVYRVDMKIDGRPIVLWSNVPNEVGKKMVKGKTK